MSLIDRIRRALTESEAATTPDADDPRLRGRTYAIPFDTVWREAVALATARLPEWNLLLADDREGLIRASVTWKRFNIVTDITIHIVLDMNAQTRVDARAVSRVRRGDLGASVRHLDRFFRALDRAVTAAAPAPVAARSG